MAQLRMARGKFGLKKPTNGTRADNIGYYNYYLYCWHVYSKSYNISILSIFDKTHKNS